MVPRVRIVFKVVTPRWGWVRAGAVRVDGRAIVRAEIACGCGVQMGRRKYKEERRERRETGLAVRVQAHGGAAYRAVRRAIAKISKTRT
jgi:hypothetical protein